MWNKRSVDTRFNDFLKDKAHVWTGMDTAEYVEVDRHRALASLPGYKQGPASSPDEIDLDGEESKILGKKMEGFEDYEFGHGMKRFFKFDKDCKKNPHRARLLMLRCESEPWQVTLALSRALLTLFRKLRIPSHSRHRRNEEAIRSDRIFPR